MSRPVWHGPDWDANPDASAVSPVVSERIADGRAKALIEAFLKQGVLEDGVPWEAGEEGTPQGGVISPLLANLYLNPLDWLMADAGFAMV